MKSLESGLHIQMAFVGGKLCVLHTQTNLQWIMNHSLWLIDQVLIQIFGKLNYIRTNLLALLLFVVAI